MDDKTIRSIIEDLLPLYNDGLLSEETARWFEEQIRGNEEYRQLLELSRKPVPAPEPAVPPAEYEKMMNKIRRKLSVYQLMLMAISFFMAISTSMMGNSFGFILWYAVLGLAAYLFYRDIKIVLLVAFVPIFLWIFGGMIVDWMQGHVTDAGFFRHLMASLAGALLGAGLHTAFALAGTAVGWLAGKKKPLTIALAVVLAVSVALVYDAFNGNPVGEWLAKQELQNYLEETYPEKELRIKDGFYNFKFSSYEFEVVEIGSVTEDGEAASYDFRVRGWIPKVVSDGIRSDQLDQDLMERLGAQAADEIERLLAPEIGIVKDVQVHLEVLKGELPEDTVWHKDLPIQGGIRLHIVLDATNASSEDVFRAAKRIQAVLNEAGYDYSHVNVNANDFGEAGAKDAGALKYAVSFDKETELGIEDVEEFNEGM